MKLLDILILVAFLESCSWTATPVAKSFQKKPRCVLFFYTVGYADNSACASPALLKEYLNSNPNCCYSDTLVVSADEMDMIVSIFNSLTPVGIIDRTNKEMYVCMEGKEICISHFEHACNMREEELNMSDTTVYFLKSISGFYNYWNQSMATYSSLLKKFGFPPDYKDILKEKKETDIHYPYAKVLVTDSSTDI